MFELMFEVVLALLLVGPGVQAQSAAGPASGQVVAPKPVEDPAVTALARKIYGQMRAGKVDAELLTAEMSQEFSPTVLAQTKPMFDQLGDPTNLELVSVAKLADGTRYDYLATFAAAQLHVRILVTAGGKVGGYALSL